MRPSQQQERASGRWLRGPVQCGAGADRRAGPSEEWPRMPECAQPSEPRISAQRLLKENRLASALHPGDAAGGGALCPLSQLQDGARVKQESPAVPGVAAAPTGAPGSGRHGARGSEDQSGLVEGSPPGLGGALLLVGG